MYFKTIFFLLTFFIINSPQFSLASGLQKFVVLSPKGTPWHPLETAVQQANVKEVQKIISSIKNGPNENRTCYYLYTSCNKAQSETQNHKLHPTTRQRYYEIFCILKNHLSKTINTTEPMTSIEQMIQEYRMAHKKVIKTIPTADQNNKTHQLRSKKLFNRFKL